MKILTAAQMQEVDRLSALKYGISNLVLMENAGSQVCSVLREKFPDLHAKNVAVFCGKGNNGGDGFVVARQLIREGSAVDIYLLASKNNVKADALTNFETLHQLQVPIHEITTPDQWNIFVKDLGEYQIIIDAILGTGIKNPVRGMYELAIRVINEATRAFIVAIDIPSGLSADSGTLIGPAIQADLTVTFTAPKIAHVFGDASSCVGELVVVPIGSPRELLESDDLYLNLIRKKDCARQIPKRKPDSHKGTYGHVLIVAGSVGKTGAAALAGLASLRMGAGLATIATAKSAQSAVASYSMELMTEALSETDQGTISSTALDKTLLLLREKDVLAIGPGLTTHPDTIQFIRRLVARSPVPVVVDADGLNALAGHPVKNEHGRPIVLTPHPGEMARLLNTTTTDIQKDRVRRAREMSLRDHVFVVLKGYRTLVAEPTGQIYVNPTGNPGMATAGSGDVLTGIIASLLVDREKMNPGVAKDYTGAICAAVYLHGLAGDLAANALGEESLIAGDIIKFLPDAIRQVQKIGSRVRGPGSS